MSECKARVYNETSKQLLQSIKLQPNLLGKVVFIPFDVGQADKLESWEREPQEGLEGLILQFEKKVVMMRFLQFRTKSRCNVREIFLRRQSSSAR